MSSKNGTCGKLESARAWLSFPTATAFSSTARAEHARSTRHGRVSAGLGPSGARIFPVLGRGSKLRNVVLAAIAVRWLCWRRSRSSVTLCQCRSLPIVPVLAISSSYPLGRPIRTSFPIFRTYTHDQEARIAIRGRWQPVTKRISDSQTTLTPVDLDSSRYRAYTWSMKSGSVGNQKIPRKHLLATSSYRRFEP